MTEAKDLDRHPIRYGTQYLGKLLEQQSKQHILGEITFAVRSEMLLVTCKDDETYQILKKCEPLLDKDFIAKLGLNCFIFQYDKYFLVLKIIKNFIKEGLSEFSFESVFEQVNAYSPARTAQAVRDVLAFFASDFSDSPRRADRFPEQLMQLRGLKPLVKRQKNNTYQLIIETKAASGKKGKANK